MGREVYILRHAVGVNVRLTDSVEFARECYWENLFVTVAKRRERNSFFRPLLIQHIAFFHIPAALGIQSSLFQISNFLTKPIRVPLRILIVMAKELVTIFLRPRALIQFVQE